MNNDNIKNNTNNKKFSYYLSMTMKLLHYGRRQQGSSNTVTLLFQTSV